MNDEHPRLEEMNEMSVLLKYYIQKVVSKMKTPKKAKEKTAPLRKYRGGSE